MNNDPTVNIIRVGRDRGFECADRPHAGRQADRESNREITQLSVFAVVRVTALALKPA